MAETGKVVDTPIMQAAAGKSEIRMRARIDRIFISPGHNFSGQRVGKPLMAVTHKSKFLCTPLDWFGLAQSRRSGHGRNLRICPAMGIDATHSSVKMTA